MEPQQSQFDLDEQLKLAEAPLDSLENGEVVALCLPPLSEKDPLLAEKKRLLDIRNLKLEFLIPLPSTGIEVLQLLDQMVRAARIIYMNEIELYFAGDNDFGPFSPRNELESLNSILGVITLLLKTAKSDAAKVLHALNEAVISSIYSVGDSNEDMIAKNFATESEGLLFKWGESHGMRAKLKIAFFKEAGRGLVASEDMKVGDIALEIPESLIISEDLVHDSDMFSILTELDGMSFETMLLLWSMRERYNSSSKFKIYFDTLPEEFNTGLSFGVTALTALEGTLLLEELLQAKEHLRKQFDALVPTLCANYPDIFRQELYTWDKFLWACELWYSNSMKVAFADGKLKTCLIPIAGFLNHSVCPHILHYGRVDPATKSLNFRVSRPCEAGHQCFLSYGTFPGSHLITFYGFLPRGDNHYDVIPLDFDAPDAGEWSNQSWTGETSRTAHMVRGTWLSKSSKWSALGLPPKLLTYLHAALADDLELPTGIPEKDIDKGSERSVFETILSIFNPMLEGLGDSDNFDRDSSSWDVKLALDYKNLQRRIICSIISSCNAGLQMLDGLLSEGSSL